MGNDISEYEKRDGTSLALAIFLKVTKILRGLGMKMNRKNKNKNMKIKKGVVNIPTKMNMTKSIEANTKQNRMEDGHEDECEQCRWQVFYDILTLPMEPGDRCTAPMSNDCQACGSAQAHARQSISSE
jgi:hypothetical protein